MIIIAVGCIKIPDKAGEYTGVRWRVKTLQHLFIYALLWWYSIFLSPPLWAWVVIIIGCHVAMLHSDYLLHRRSLLDLFSFLHFCKYERGPWMKRLCCNFRHSFFITKICPSKRAAAAECKHAANNPTNIATHELLSGTLQLLANQTQNIKTCQHALASRAVNEPSRKIHKVEAPTSY